MTPNPDSCPVVTLARQVSASADELAGSIGQLRRRMKLCDQCEVPCQMIRELSSAIDRAILRVADELNLRI